MEYKSNISKRELVSAFSEIDDRINNLYVRCNSDFMKLNEYLKDYHKKTKIISENAFRILETISGGSDMELIKELRSIHERTKLCNNGIIDDFRVRLRIFNDINNTTNQLFVLLRNLRQDFITLRFLSSNYSLLSAYNDSDASLPGDEAWNSALDKLHFSLLSLNKQVFDLKETVSSVIKKINTKEEKSIELFRSLSDETIRIIDMVNRKNHESKIHFPDLREKTTETSKNISDIITHLQYQDIIRQKIEHIRKSHNGIIDDLSSQNESSEINCLHEDQVKISDIIELQSAQLMLVCKEYQNAVNVITRNFQKIANDMSAVAEISDNLSFENSGTTLLRKISSRLDNGIIQLDLINENMLRKECLESGKSIKSSLCEIEEDIGLHLESFAGENRIIKLLKFTGAGSGVFTQMIALNRDMELKILETKEKITELKKHIDGYITYDDKESEENPYEIERLQLMVKITRILDLLDRGNEELDKVLLENKGLNSDILQKIETAVNKSDYNEYFENTVGKIISRLSGINDMIRPASREQCQQSKEGNLKEMKENYTMASERIIHEMMISGNGKNETTELEDKDNDIEFF
jgi:hypothetical protein